MEIIAINGLIGSGKDTVADILIEEYGYVKISFADALKDVISSIFMWDRSKLNGYTVEDREWREQPDQYWSECLGYKFTPRIALQVIGTNLFREHFNKNIWIYALKKKLLDLSKINSKIVITDCRYGNEIQLVRSLGATLIEIQRGELPEWYETVKQININERDGKYIGIIKPIQLSNIHESEYSWIGINEPDHIILNNSTKAVLKDIVLSLVK